MNLGAAYSKSLLTNGSLWFWGAAFMLFWIVIGAYVESSGYQLSGPGLSAYAGAWYAVVVLLSLSMLAIAIANSLTYGSAALAYAFRYTTLTPARYLGAVVLASAIFGLILGFVILGGTVAIFGARFHAAIVPSNVPALVAVSLGAGVFYMALATNLMLLVINYLGLRSASMVGYVPLLLSYAFGLGQAFTTLPTWLLYGSPYNAITSLLYQGFTGAPVPVMLGSTGSVTLAGPLLVVGLVAWTVGLAVTATILLRRIRARNLEEGRQI